MSRYRAVLVVLLGAISMAVSHAQTPRSADFWSEFDAESSRIRKADSLFVSPSWTGETFKASLEYPTSPPPAEAGPWLALRVESDPRAYLRKVLEYVLEGNEEVDWRVQDNKVRKWFHAPWMTFNKNGREPIRGLTKERDSDVGELDRKQTTKVRNWAVGIYNAPGGYVLGQVWRDPRQPNTKEVAFPIGTVTAKLLFTEASPEMVDLVNSPQALVWKAAVKGRIRTANAADAFSQPTEPQDMRLLQLDLAVRDERVPTSTGWVFGTYYFDAAQPGSKWHEKLVLGGVMWGNDANLTHADYKAGLRPKHGFVNPVAASRFGPSRRCGELGLRGRVNGPVDNSLSSCLSCHGRAYDILPAGKTMTELLENPRILGTTPGFVPPKEALGLVADSGSEIDDAKAAAGEPVVRRWFRDLGHSESFDSGFHSLDYSLQLADGIANFYAWAIEFEKNWRPTPASSPTGMPMKTPLKACVPYCLSGFDCITNFGRAECVESAPESRPTR